MAGMRDIYRMTAPLGYANGGQPITIEQIIRDAETSRGPAEVTHPIQKIISDRTIVDPYSVSQKERLKEMFEDSAETKRKVGQKINITNKIEKITPNEVVTFSIFSS